MGSHYSDGAILKIKLREDLESKTLSAMSNLAYQHSNLMVKQMKEAANLGYFSTSYSIKLPSSYYFLEDYERNQIFENIIKFLSKELDDENITYNVSKTPEKNSSSVIREINFGLHWGIPETGQRFDKAVRRYLYS